MNTYTVKGKAIDCIIKADNATEARRILSAPIVEVIALLGGVHFERKI